MSPARAVRILASLLIVAACSGARADDFKPTAQALFAAPDAHFELVWDAGEFTEGPAAAADGTIYFSDIGDRILRFDPSTGKTTVYRQPSHRANGLIFDHQGRLVACEGANGGGRRISITESDGTVRALTDRYQGRRYNSPNDLAVAPNGHLYFTDPRYIGDELRELDFQGVFVVESTGHTRLATRDVEQPNGILVSPDGHHVYLADNSGRPEGNHHLLRFDVATDGTLAGKQVLHDFGPNRRGIDGMTLDAVGNIYATAGSGAEAGVYVFNRDGMPLAFLSSPGTPTNCVFGIGEEANVLYLTAGIPGDEPSTRETRFGLYRQQLNLPHGS